jgi:hypothetical protein
VTKRSRRRTSRQDCATPTNDKNKDSSPSRLRKQSAARALVGNWRSRRAEAWLAEVLEAGRCPACLAHQCPHCARELERVLADRGSCLEARP